MRPLLEARGVGYAVRGAELVRGVDLALLPGQLVALAGPNGAGKSTLLALLAGDLAPDAGEVLVAGRPAGAYAAGELARLRALLPQQTVLEFAFSVEQVVAFGRSPHRRRFGGPDPDDGRAVTAAMTQADVRDLADRRFPTLSAGEQARVSLARVLAQETEILLLDEPTAALDLRHQELVMRLARRLARAGRGVAAVVHDLNLAARYADAVLLLKDGAVAAYGAPADVLTPERVEDVFEQAVHVLAHPDGGHPLVVPRAAA
jgi:iron complex transport system ATP-binding protein